VNLEDGEEQELPGGEDGWVDHPAVSDQVVVWEDSRETDNRIVALDLTSGEEGPVSDGWGMASAISGDWVVWEEEGTGPDKERTFIVARNLVSGLERTLANRGSAFSVSGDWLVWDIGKGRDEGHVELNEIWGMRLSTGKRMLLRPLSRCMLPVVEDGWVLWRRSDDRRVEAFSLRTRKVRLLPRGATTASDDGRVLICVGGQAAFDAGRNRLLVYELTSGRSARVSGATGRITWAGIHDGWVAWYDETHEGPLRVANLDSGETTTVAEAACLEPDLSRD
jgi:hypothetical protein